MADEAAKTEEKIEAPAEVKPDKRFGKDLIHIKVFAPFTEYFEGEAHGVSAVNESGPFDVLAHHHNFITMLLPCDLVVHAVEGDKTFRITRGLMHVRESKVIVFLDV